MDWSDERYVRLYTRDTATWKRLKWEGQTVLMHLLRKVDRAGFFDFDSAGPEDAIAEVTGLPLEIVTVGLERLVERGSVVITATSVMLPKFIEAQESVQTDAQRQREYRARKRDTAVKKRAEDGPPVVAIYFLQSSHTQDIKIGVSTNIKNRVASLQTAHGAPIEILAQVEAKNAPDLEGELHLRFQQYKKLGEWFFPAAEILACAKEFAAMPGATGSLCQSVTSRDADQTSRSVTVVTPRDTGPLRPVTVDPSDVTPRSQNVTPSLAQPSLAVPTRDRSGNRSSKTASSSQAEASPAGAREAPAPAAASEQGLPARPVRKSALVSKPVDSAGYQPMPEHETYAVAMGLTPDEYRAVLAEMVGKFAARGYAPLERWDTRLAGFVDSAALNKKSRPKARAAPTPQPKIGFGGALSRSFFGSQLDDDDEEVKQA
jgi:hypothetical protein